MTTDKEITIRGQRGRYASIPVNAVEAALTEDDYDDMMNIHWYVTFSGVEDDSMERRYDVYARRAAEMLRNPESPYYDPDLDAEPDYFDIAI